MLLQCSELIILVILVSASGKQELKCGRPLGSEFVVKTDRVVGGYDVGYYKYPWYAALIQNKQVSCGGALIGPKTVITAAHCYREYLQTTNTSNIKLERIYTVRLGMYNICTTESTVNEFKVEKVQVHELYLSKTPYYDICLLTLANSTDQYEPLCLPNGVITSRPKEGNVPGMGTLRFQGGMPCTLHEARLLIYPDSTCAGMINSTGNDAGAIKNAFCAGYLAGGIDTCQGDSGGPLQILDENGRYVLLGVVSFGFHCAVPKYLGMYTDVSQYVKWIKEKSQSDLQFINSFSTPHADEPTTETTVSDSGHHKHHYHHHHGYSHQNPITIIILRSGKQKSIGTYGKQRKKHSHNVEDESV